MAPGFTVITKFSRGAGGYQGIWCFLFQKVTSEDIMSRMLADLT